MGLRDPLATLQPVRVLNHSGEGVIGQGLADMGGVDSFLGFAWVHPALQEGDPHSLDQF